MLGSRQCSKDLLRCMRLLWPRSSKAAVILSALQITELETIMQCRRNQGLGPAPPTFLEIAVVTLENNAAQRKFSLSCPPPPPQIQFPSHGSVMLICEIFFSLEDQFSVTVRCWTYYKIVNHHVPVYRDIMLLWGLQGCLRKCGKSGCLVAFESGTLTTWIPDHASFEPSGLTCSLPGAHSCFESPVEEGLEYGCAGRRAITWHFNLTAGEKSVSFWLIDWIGVLYYSGMLKFENVDQQFSQVKAEFHEEKIRFWIYFILLSQRINFYWFKMLFE